MSTPASNGESNETLKQTEQIPSLPPILTEEDFNARFDACNEFLIKWLNKNNMAIFADEEFNQEILAGTSSISRLIIQDHETGETNYAICKLPRWGEAAFLDQSLLCKEIVTLRLLQEAGISNISKIFVGQLGNATRLPCLITHYAGDNNLYTWSKRQNRNTKEYREKNFKIMDKVAETLDKTAKIAAHTDIKEDNIMVDEKWEDETKVIEIPTIIDWGATKRVGVAMDSEQLFNVYTVGYAPLPFYSNLIELTEGMNEEDKIEFIDNALLLYMKQCLASTLSKTTCGLRIFGSFTGDFSNDQYIGIKADAWTPDPFKPIDVIDSISNLRRAVGNKKAEYEVSLNTYPFEPENPAADEIPRMLKEELDNLKMNLAVLEGLNANQIILMQAWVNKVCSKDLKLSCVEITEEYRKIFE